ncbi:MAG TPA: antitermination protein NusG [Prolixibacteraceae bacterium]|jgi:transcription antitermination factor NusG|nr:antitermination protein NusG [Prolixibacteraceae bacterium]
MEKIIQPNTYYWHAVYVKSRAEKKAQSELQTQEIDTFLPLQRKLRQWSDRKKWVEMPLISGYLFVRASRKEYDQVLQSNYIVSYVRFEGKAAVVPDSQIEYLKLMLSQDNTPIEITQEKLKPGQMIEVVSGPFIGLKGKLQKIKGKSKVAVELEQLGYSALVEIQTENIQPFKDSKQ